MKQQHALGMKANSIVESYINRDLSRREALTHLFSLGIQATAAYTALGLMETSEATTQPLGFSSTDLRDMATKLTTVVADPEVVAAVEKVSDAAGVDAKDSAAKNVITTVMRLAKDKYHLQNDYPRACLRVFEKDAKGKEHEYATAESYKNALVFTNEDSPTSAIAQLQNELGHPLPSTAVHPLSGTVCGSLGYIACISYGIPR